MVIDFKQDILSPVATDFAAMDHLINEGISSKVGLVMSVSKHVVEAGGKRMRPIMCLLAARACGVANMQHAQHLAAIIEMLHTATLVHDDVVDESNLRRGRPTANATWNNQTAVLVGDFLIARAFDLLVDLNNITFQQEPVRLRKARFYSFRPSTSQTPLKKPISELFMVKPHACLNWQLKARQFWRAEKNIVSHYAVLLAILAMPFRLLMIFWTTPLMPTH